MFDVGGVEFEEVALAVDEDGALQRGLGEGIVPDAVVREVVEDFEGEEVAGGGHVGLPGEDGAVDDFDVRGVAARGGVTVELAGLQRGERGGDFDDFELGARVDVRVVVADVVQDVEHEGAVAGAEFVDYEVVEGMVGEFVVGDEIAGNCLAVVGAKELGGGVPKLACLVVGFGVQVVLKGGVSFA